MPLIFDGHGDIAIFALAYNRDQTERVAAINAKETGMTDSYGRACAANSLPEMRHGRVAVCVSSLAARVRRDCKSTLRTDLDFATHRMAYASAHGQLAYYRVLAEENEIRLIRTQDELNEHWTRWESLESDQSDLPIGIIVSMECADPIVRPKQVEQWWKEGLRTVMLTHFGHSQYAAGTGVTGPLTAAGRELLDEMDQLGMILDLSHACDESFFESIERFTGPVIASHNNCRALVPGDRQLSDSQIKLLLSRGGVIGSVLDAWMLVPGWIHGKSKPEEVQLTAVADHINHVCQLAGNSLHASIGSDIGGTNHMPSDFRTTADLQKLDEILASRGYSSEDINNIFHGNWLRFFQRSLP